MINLLVIGVGGHDPGPIERVAKKVGRGTNDCYVMRCGSPEHLPQLVARAASVLGKIDLLDIYDHCAVGRMRLGPQILFSSDDNMGSILVGADIARALLPHLTETAHVRLLGCNTAGDRDLTVEPLISDSAGRCLLLKLALELGAHRVADGTIILVNELAFHPGGFSKDLTALWSSSASLDHDPVKQDCRGPHIQKFYEPYTANLPRLAPPPPIVSLARRARRALFDLIVV